MDVSQSKLRQLATVARCGSFSRAAEELHISQPALSRSIASIERRCGFAIFNRIGHGVEPTYAGAQLLARAQPLLQSMRVFDSNLRSLASGKAGTLKVGLPPLLASEILARFAGDFFTPEHQVELRVSVRSGPALLEELKAEAIELLYFADSQIEPAPDIEIERAGHISPTLVARRDHPLARRTDLRVEDLSAFPWASSIEPPAMGAMLNPARFICDNYHILRDTVLHTDLLCICSRAFVAAEISDGRLCELDVGDFLPPHTAIFLVTLKDRIASPLATAAVRRISALLDRSP